MDVLEERPSLPATPGVQIGGGGISNALDTPLVPGLCPRLAILGDRLVTQAAGKGLKVGIFCGLRTPEASEALYAQGRTKKGDIVTYTHAWESWHNYGLAFDCAFLTENKGEWYWPRDSDPRWKVLGELGESLGLTWGGRWVAPKTDLPHFEMRAGVPSIKVAKEILFKNGIEALWRMA